MHQHRLSAEREQHKSVAATTLAINTQAKKTTAQDTRYDPRAQLQLRAEAHTSRGVQGTFDLTNRTWYLHKV
eukprot:908379-Pelagomonas_calceolata.AAC.2